MVDAHVAALEGEPIHFTARAHQVVHADEIVRPALEPGADERRTHEAASSSHEDLHGAIFLCQFSTISRIVGSRLIVMSQRAQRVPMFRSSL